MRTRQITALVLGLSMSVSGAALLSADATAAEGSKIFYGPIDLNDDGKVDQKELQAYYASWFDVVDDNGDGVVTAEELNARAVGSRQYLVAFDVDQDRLISKEEFDSGMQRTYETAAEGEPEGQAFTRDYKEQAYQRDERLVPSTDAEVTEDMAAADWERSFRRADRNQDDQLSEDEWVFGSADAPDRGELDSDEDGIVTRAEYIDYGRRNYEEMRQGLPQVSTRDYNEGVRWRDEALVPTTGTDAGDMVTAEEAEADRDRFFSSLDRDGDGVLSEDEWDDERAGLQDLGDKAGIMAENTGITRDEFIGAREQEFSQADLNGDGEVSVWEYRAFRRL